MVVDLLVQLGFQAMSPFGNRLRSFQT